VPRAGVLSLSLWSRTDAEAVRLAVLPAAAVRSAVIEIEPAASRHVGGLSVDVVGTGLVLADTRSAFKQPRQGNRRWRTSSPLRNSRSMCVPADFSASSKISASRNRCSIIVSAVTLSTMHHRAHCVKTTSSAKPEVHNVSQCHQRRTEPRPETTCTKIGKAWHTHHNTWQPSRGKVTTILLKVI